MKGKEPKKSKATKEVASTTQVDGVGDIGSKDELRAYLLNVRDKLTEGVAAPIYGLAAMNHVMTIPQIYDWLDNESKEIARDIWLRLRQSGMQVRNPPLLFAADEELPAAQR